MARFLLFESMRNFYSLRQRQSSKHKHAGISMPIKASLSNEITKSANQHINEIKLKHPLNWIMYCEQLAKNYQQQEKYLDAATCYKARGEKRGAKINDLIK